MHVDAVRREDERRQLGDRVVALVDDDDRRFGVRLVAPAVQAGALQLCAGVRHRVELRRGEELRPLRQLVRAQAALLRERGDRRPLGAAGVVLVLPRGGEVLVRLRQHGAGELRVLRVERRFDLRIELRERRLVRLALRPAPASLISGARTLTGLPPLGPTSDRMCEE